MAAAWTALALTVLYVALVVLNPPLAAAIGVFYLAAVAILVVPQQAKVRRARRTRP